MSGLKPYTGPWDEVHLIHLLRRTLWGVSIEDIKKFKGKTLDECLDVLLTPTDPIEPDPPVNSYSVDDLKDPYIPFGKVWVHAPKPVILEDLQFINEERRNNCLKGWWAGQMINQKMSLSEKMLVFWHNNLATQSKFMLDVRYLYWHTVLLRRHALGNFKTLVREVTTDPCMLVYLNGNTNIKGTPNENYGRELQEFFTVGKGKDSHYTEDDVKAAAKVLTGWRDNPDEILSYFDADEHDTSDKKFSAFYNNHVIKGRTGMDGAKETDELIDMLFAKEETAKSLSRKLYRWFVHYDLNDRIEAEVITPLSEIVIKNNYNIVPVLRALLSCDCFYDEELRGQMIKSGLDYAVGAVRQFELSFPPATDIAPLYDAWYAVAGGAAQFLQEVGDPPSVAGWPAYYESPTFYKRWIDSNLLQFRRAVVNGFASSFGLPAQGHIFRIDVIAFTSKLENPSDPAKLIDSSLNIILPLPLADAQKEFMKQILNGSPDETKYWTNLWTAFSNDPGNTKLREEVDEKLRVFYTYIVNLSEYQMM
jgi:hypothetical protein